MVVPCTLGLGWGIGGLRERESRLSVVHGRFDAMFACMMYFACKCMMLQVQHLCIIHMHAVWCASCSQHRCTDLEGCCRNLLKQELKVLVPATRGRLYMGLNYVSGLFFTCWGGPAASR
jgi:hypothetical protein